jgi:hypothetical protein
MRHARVARAVYRYQRTNYFWYKKPPYKNGGFVSKVGKSAYLRLTFIVAIRVISGETTALIAL